MISESGFLRRFKEHFLPELYFDTHDKVVVKLCHCELSISTVTITIYVTLKVTFLVTIMNAVTNKVIVKCRVLNINRKTAQ